MRLRQIEAGHWTVLAMCDERGCCQVQEFVDGLLLDSRDDYDQVVALLRRTAAHGPPRSDRVSRKLSDDIYELKTRGGMRATAERLRYLEARRSRDIEVIREDP